MSAIRSIPCSYSPNSGLLWEANGYSKKWAVLRYVNITETRSALHLVQYNYKPIFFLRAYSIEKYNMHIIVWQLLNCSHC